MAADAHGPARRAGRRHRHDRRRPQHRGQGARGPRLLRRRQPAAEPAARRGPAGRREPRHRAAGRGRRRRPLRLVLRVPAGQPRPGRDRAARDAGLPRGHRRRAGTPPGGRPPPAPAAGRRPAARRAAARARGAGRAARRRRPGHRHHGAQRAPAHRPDRRGVRHARHHAGSRSPSISFGFKYGIPVDADFVADMRFLPNPYWIPELRAAHRHATPRSPTTCCRQPGAAEFLDGYVPVLEGVAEATCARASGS